MYPSLPAGENPLSAGWHSAEHLSIGINISHAKFPIDKLNSSIYNNIVNISHSKEGFPCFEGCFCF